MRPRLKLFCGEEDGGLAMEPSRVSMKFSDFFQVVAEATRYKRTWLQDFAEDDVQIPEDLYEVLSAYWTLRPGA
ncbi:MAG: hypothetical protein ACK5Q5_16560 [Planctomycetaceae bacterium]